MSDRVTTFHARIDQMRALAEPTRLRLFRLLSRYELTVTELTAATDQSQPSISRHLKLLCEAGLAARHQEGAWVFYRGVAAPGLGDPLDGVEDSTLDRDDERLAGVLDERRRTAARYFALHAKEWDGLRREIGDDEEAEQAIRSTVIALAGTDGRLGRLLDLGTGTARMLIVLEGLYCEGVGFDSSPEMLAVARANLHDAEVRGARVRRADILDLDGQVEEGDLVILHHVLRYLSDPFEAVRTAIGLSAKGRLIITDLAPHMREDLRERYALRRLGFSDEEVRGWAEAAGAELRWVRTFGRAGSDLMTKLWMIEGEPSSASAFAQEQAASAHV